jgi:hypothetical protein
MNPTQDNNNYPVFEANQVLTETHLNKAINYLDEQERLTRANLIGIGIVCGLEMSVDKITSTITVTKGCGISSEGYFLVQPNDIILKCYKEYFLPEEKDSDSLYSAFLNSDHNQCELQEIVPDNEDNKDSELLTNSVLNNKAILLFLELKKDSLRSCSANSCDDKGKAITTTLRYLLIAKNDLKDIIAKANNFSTELTAADLETNLLAKLNLPDLRLPRYSIPNGNLITSNDVLKAFHTVFQKNQLTKQVADALSKTYEAFKTIVQNVCPDGDPFASFNEKFGFLDSDTLSTTQMRFLQYYYDFFDDLIKAYDEFRWKALALLCACCPSEELFPRHLMLGLASAKGSSVYRQGFLAASANNNCDEGRKEVVLLFSRLVEMIAQFTNIPLLKVDSIRITPSKFADVPLSDKAIPYYYQQSGEPPLFELWNPEKTLHHSANQNLSYRSDEYAPVTLTFVTDPLRYDLEPYNFLRIEGHLGKNYQSTMTVLLTLKKDYRLPIEVLALHTSNLQEPNQNKTLHNFLIKHPGIQHKAGVPLGGTFILVCHDSLGDEIDAKQGDVIADFFLPYRVIESDCQCQILTKECEYEWIDSIKHLNNLILRDYRFTATRKAPAANEKEGGRLRNGYIIRIYRYEIQGKSILSGNSPEDVVIPVSTLKAGKLSAVARKLNETYPLGAVFGCKADSNKILIRRLEGHTIRIELGGLQGNQIRYLYENDKIYHWQQETWQELNNGFICDSTCHTSGGDYKQEDYKWLHENYPPQYPEPPISPTAKEVITWERLTLKRARNWIRSDSPALPIHSVLNLVLNAIQQIDSNAHVVLIGSWANGSWISRNPNENEKTIDTITWTEFLQLRKKVTGKTGCSDIDLLIDSELEITPDMIKVSTAGYTINIIRGKQNAQKGLVLTDKEQA